MYLVYKISNQHYSIMAQWLFCGLRDISIKDILYSVLTVPLRALYVSQNKQGLLTCTTLTERFIYYRD